MTTESSITGTAGDELAWKSHPWSDDPPVRRLLAVLLVTGFSVYGWWGFDSVGVGLLSFGFLFVSLFRYFCPTMYRLAPDGVHISILGMGRHHSWARFRRVAKRPEGAFLGTFDTPRRLDVWRGCYVRCPEMREQVLEYARTQIRLAQDSGRNQARSGDESAIGTDG
jgi:hypothetical protein